MAMIDDDDNLFLCEKTFSAVVVDKKGRTGDRTDRVSCSIVELLYQSSMESDLVPTVQFLDLPRR